MGQPWQAFSVCPRCTSRPSFSTSNWSSAWNIWRTPKPEFRYRSTHVRVHDHVFAETGEKLWPLSPSTDRISLTAWRLAGLRETACERSRSPAPRRSA
jgi:hypothetical protein